MGPSSSAGVAVLMASVLLTACGGSSTEAADGERSDGLEVVATTSILGDVATNLVGDDGSVTVLVPPGIDPHGFEPSAADVAALRDADIVVANGLGLEEQLTSALDAARDEGVPVVEVAEELDPIAFVPPDHAPSDDASSHDPSSDHPSSDHPSSEHASDHDEDRHVDPHVWFDPLRMADGVDVLASEFAEVGVGVGDDAWQARAQAYREELLRVHAELQERFDDIPPEQRKLVTNHATFGYLADRYGFEVVGTVLPGTSPHGEASAGGFARLIEELEAEGVTTVFAEHTDGTALAEQLAMESRGSDVGAVEVVRVHTGSLGEPGSGAETYLGLLRTTADQIADALG